MSAPGAQNTPYDESVELARLVVADSVPANGETFCASRALRLAAESGVRGIGSFADPVPRRRVTAAPSTAASALAPFAGAALAVPLG
ncbi:hypothetical protein ACFQ2K_06025 [Streptomyces sanglieri]|uniref:Cytidine deaminase n=1 Tax=Streptomyces sanglieri TaxID=193460 RepID=A0ABW2WL68_9ACTN